MPTWSYPPHHEFWSHRSVIYFAPSYDKHVEQFLLETLINECELHDRDLITLVITEDGFTTPSWIEAYFDTKSLFTIFQVEQGSHTALLIGKDGDVKMRWGKKTDWKKVKQTIDLMPLRRQEKTSPYSPCSA
jgi:hypothetical protein